ncbi:ABC transporter ATP-binding protein [Actinotalea sp. M2MS4P-6]|uniref:ABC transporter ATP-binding protein n=1 Tax=Actinotalea sp. M2MS4P-6 TaxID=2983762 RepID=UPI0021E4F0F2|nr:ABC transporter ATP-binding protein [Actinotalea sp. M2MS4P-6]MCV2392694.1 ABC transporter ATP-binding protein [Actinotalea sp. M2MS4P-6]
MNDLAIAVRHLDATRGTFHLRDVSFELPTGFVMGFVGRNGAGKTTTIRCLLGMLTPDAGEIEVLGQPLPADPALREDIGVVLDHSTLVEDWRLTEVERALAPFYSRWDGARYRALLEEFELDPRHKVKELSRGQAMKLGITLALSHHARLLVLDEPTSGLDPAARDELVSILGDFLTDDGHSVLFSTHITSDLERIADYVTVIDAGRVVDSAPKDELLDAYRLVRGGPEDLVDPDVDFLGLRRNETGAEALVAAGQVDRLSGDLVVDRPTLDEIVVKMGDHR